MFEHRKQALLPRRDFRAGLARSVSLALAIVLRAHGIGRLGYRRLEI